MFPRTDEAGRFPMRHFEAGQLNYSYETNILSTRLLAVVQTHVDSRTTIYHNEKDCTAGNNPLRTKIATIEKPWSTNGALTKDRSKLAGSSGRVMQKTPTPMLRRKAEAAPHASYPHEALLSNNRLA